MNSTKILGGLKGLCVVALALFFLASVATAQTPDNSNASPTGDAHASAGSTPATTHTTPPACGRWGCRPKGCGHGKTYWYRPHGFGAHCLGIASSSGWSLAGAFNQGLNQSTYVPINVRGHGGTDPLDPLSWALYYTAQPPLTPEEQDELDVLDLNCCCIYRPGRPFNWNHYSRHKGLQDKYCKFYGRRREMTMGLWVNGKSFAMVEYNLAVELNCYCSTEVPYVTTITRDTNFDQIPRPWLKGFRPISLTATIVQNNAGTKPPVFGKIDVRFFSYQGWYVMFGGLEQGLDRSFVISQSWYYAWKHGRPWWHYWAPPGREENDELHCDHECEKTMPWRCPCGGTLCCTSCGLTMGH